MSPAKTGAGSVPSMQNVAAYAGVSIATVSKVMQGDPTVRSGNVTAVQNAIEALGYRINPLASELRRGRRKLIGVVVPSFEGAMAALVESLEHHAGEHGYALWAASSSRSEHREADIIGRFQDWRVAGLIIVPVPSESGSSVLMINDTTATVFLESVSPMATFDTVATEFEGAAAALVERLAALGHRRVAVVMPVGNDAVSARMKAAFDVGAATPSGVRVSWLELDAVPRSAIRKAGAQLGGAGRPSAVVAIGAEAASMVLAYAAGRRWGIPADLSIVTLTDERAALGDPRVAALFYPADALAARAVRAILRRVDQPAAAVVRGFEPCTFRDGETIGAPRPIAAPRSIRQV